MGKTILTPKQYHFLELASGTDEITKWFYLTGGTALSEFYLHHRLSEDLDFFSDNEINDTRIDLFMRDAAKQLHGTVEKDTHIAIFVYYLTFDKQPKLKIDFATNPFNQLEKGVRFHNLQIASLWDIVVDKFYTMLNRVATRDFVDLYFGIQEVGCNSEQLVTAVEEKYEMSFSNVNTASRFLRIQDLKDLPTMLVPLDRKKMEAFYFGLAKSLEKKIFD